MPATTRAFASRHYNSTFYSYIYFAGTFLMADKRPMTPAGHAQLKAELKKLKDVDRPANARAIEIARGHGDLSENADYDAAKNDQGLMEARIRQLESLLNRAEVRQASDDGTVQAGSVVTVRCACVRGTRSNSSRWRVWRWPSWRLAIRSRPRRAPQLPSRKHHDPRCR